MPRLGYGAMQLAGPGVIGLPDDVTGAIEVLRRATDLGVRFFDTANAYGPRTVNQLIGRALSLFDDIVIGNKVGATRDPAGGWLADNRPQTLRTQVEEALLVRHIGLSGASPEILERAQHVTPIAAVQNRFNLIDRSSAAVQQCSGAGGLRAAWRGLRALVSARERCSRRTRRGADAASPAARRRHVGGGPGLAASTLTGDDPDPGH